MKKKSVIGKNVNTQNLACIKYRISLYPFLTLSPQYCVEFLTPRPSRRIVILLPLPVSCKSFEDIYKTYIS